MRSFNFTQINLGAGGIKLLLVTLMTIFIISCSGGDNGGGDNPPPPGTASIVLSPNLLEFGDVVPNESKTLSITVTNAGDTQATGLSLGGVA